MDTNKHLNLLPFTRRSLLGRRTVPTACPVTLRIAGYCAVTLASFAWASSAAAEDYHVDGSQYESLSDVPWGQVGGGDTVFIHWRAEPYRENFGIDVSGDSWDAPLRISGVPGANGQLPVLDGEDSVAGPNAHQRGILSVRGGAQYVVVENLEVRGANQSNGYPKGSSGIYAENGSHLLFNELVLTDNDNGMFSAPETADITVRGCTLYGNGVEGSIFEHNSYTESDGILFEFNTFGLLRSGAGGSNLKDRSAHMVLRYNWIDGGNRVLDLVEPEYGQPMYGDAAANDPHFVYGNVLIKRNDGTTNDQVIHFGGDQGNGNYRRQLFFYHNTVESTRSSTTVFLLDADDAAIDVRNNVFTTEGSPSSLKLFDSDTAGSVAIAFNTNFVPSGRGGSNPSGLDEEGTISGDPDFRAPDDDDLFPAEGSPLIDVATALAPGASDHPVEFQLVAGGEATPRVDTVLDVGALEACGDDCGPPPANTTEPATSVPGCTGDCSGESTPPGGSTSGPSTDGETRPTGTTGPGGSSSTTGPRPTSTPGGSGDGSESSAPGGSSTTPSTNGAEPTSLEGDGGIGAAPVAASSEASCSCRLPGAPTGKGSSWVGVAAILGGAFARRRGRRRAGAHGADPRFPIL